MILITGANGQLGKSFRNLISKGDAFFCGSNDLDITNLKQLYSFFKNNEITYIINCAAYTNVEKAEQEADKAYAINKYACYNLAVISRDYDVPLVHVSTDYVFDGNKGAPYKEDDDANPINIYGKSKREGELQILKTANRSCIIRTSWLYSVFENNFVDKVLGFLSSTSEVKIVNDQIGAPTFSEDLAECIMSLINNGVFYENEIFHYSNEGAASWYDFACCISRFSGINKEIIPVSSEKFPTIAPRPKFSLLSKEKIKNRGVKINHWMESLEKCLHKKTY